MKISFIYFAFLIGLFIACKQDGKNTISSDTKVADNSQSTGNTSKFETLDHDFKLIPEGSKLFIKGFFDNQLISCAMTVGAGVIHVKNSLLEDATLILDVNSIHQVAEKNEAIESFLKGAKGFNASKYPTGTFSINECIKALNDQQATHLLKGTIELNGESVDYSARARVDYTQGSISINSEPLVIKAAEFKIPTADPSQENIYFTLTLNGDLPK